MGRRKDVDRLENPRPLGLGTHARLGALFVALLVGGTAAACGTPNGEDPERPAPAEEPEEPEEAEEPDEEEPPEPEGLRHAAVTAAEPSPPLRQGDSVAVTFEPLQPTGHWAHLHAPEEGSAPGDGIPATELGPLPGATGWVTATTLTVRACPDPGCETVGSLRQGHTTEVHALEDGWYALDETEERWASAEYIAVEEGWSEVLAGMVVDRFADFYEEYVSGRRPEGAEEGEPLFSEWHLGVAGGETLQVILASNHNQGPAGQEVCQWAHSSAEILERAAAELRGFGVDDHHVEVHYRGRPDEPVARLGEDGEITCILRG